MFQFKSGSPSVMEITTYIRLTHVSPCAFCKLEYGHICSICVYQKCLSSPFFFFSRRDLEIERPVPGVNVVTLQ